MTSNIEYICEGCPKVNRHFLTCSVYATPPPAYLRECRCPFNPPKEKVVTGFKRVGQQKQKKKG